MLELESEIAIWKQEIVSNGAVSSEEACELEAHVRDSVASLQEKGLAADEAFMVSANRLGHPLELQKEYSKNDTSVRWKQPVFWMLAGWLGLEVIGDVITIIGTTVGTSMAYGGFGGSESGVAMVTLMAIAWCSIFVIAFRSRQRFVSKRKGVPLKWIAGSAALLVVARAIRTVSHVLPIAVAGLDWYSEAATYLFIGGFALNFCLVTLCFVALWKLNERDAWNAGRG